MFITKLNAVGSALAYSTYLGGSEVEEGYGIAVDSNGSAYVTGDTQSNDFPTADPIYSSFDGGNSIAGDVFVAKFSLGGTPVESETPLAELPEAYALHQNYPNPFNAITEIRYKIPEEDHVTLKIFNTLGQEVWTLVEKHREAGLHEVSWDSRDSAGREVASGVYFCRLEAGDFHKTIKMVLIK